MKKVKTSVVINTYNEEKNIERCLCSAKGFADEIIVVDMHSSDRTVDIAQKFGAKIFQHEYTRFVEPARNFALRQAQGKWILLLDADEELTENLAVKLHEIANENKADSVEIPRKNIIFGKWIEHSRWWPDYLVRFFRSGKVTFSDKIHVPPVVKGEKLTLDAKEENAIIHYNFQTISQFIERLNRYTDIQSEELERQDYKFKVEDLITKSSGEFFSRFFSGEGYKDKLHGLVLAGLQAFSEFIVYLKVWEKQGFKEERIDKLNKFWRKLIKELYFWQQKTASGFINKILLKFRSKI